MVADDPGCVATIDPLLVLTSDVLVLFSTDELDDGIVLVLSIGDVVGPMVEGVSLWALLMGNVGGDGVSNGVFDGVGDVGGDEVTDGVFNGTGDVVGDDVVGDGVDRVGRGRSEFGNITILDFVPA